MKENVPFKLGSIIKSSRFIGCVYNVNEGYGVCDQVFYMSKMAFERYQIMELHHGLELGFPIVKGRMGHDNKPIFDCGAIDETRGIALFRVIEMKNTGGGKAMFNDYYPDGLHVRAERLDKQETIHFVYNNNSYITSIYQNELEIVEF